MQSFNTINLHKIEQYGDILPKKKFYVVQHIFKISPLPTSEASISTFFLTFYNDIAPTFTYSLNQ